MKKWEYLETSSFDQVQELGLEGWELVYMIIGRYKCDLYILKRELPS